MLYEQSVILNFIFKYYLYLRKEREETLQVKSNTNIMYNL